MAVCIDPDNTDYLVLQLLHHYQGFLAAAENKEMILKQQQQELKQQQQEESNNFSTCHSVVNLSVDRIEIYLYTRQHSTRLAEMIMGKIKERHKTIYSDYSPKQMRERIIEYVVKRLHSTSNDITLQPSTISSIHNPNKVPHHTVHVDITREHGVQATFALSNGTAMTEIFEPAIPDISTFQTAVTNKLLSNPPGDGLLSKLFEDDWESIYWTVPHGQYRDLREMWFTIIPYLTALNVEYKKVFPSLRNSIKIGGGILIPGGTFHRGPASEGFRCIIFAAANQPSQLAYDGVTAFSRCSLLAWLATKVWAYVEVDEKRYLLNEIREACPTEAEIDLVSYQAPPMVDFAKLLREKQTNFETILYWTEPTLSSANSGSVRSRSSSPA